MNRTLKFLLVVFVCTMVLPLISLPAWAGLVEVDFRDEVLFGGHGDRSYSMEFDALGIELTVSSGSPWSALWRDNRDGYGIQTRFKWWFRDREQDEIGGMESLNIKFSDDVNLRGVSITDLFFEHGYHEIGMYSLDDGIHWNFFKAESDQLPGKTNGELDIEIDAMTDSILFAAPGWMAFQSHEFSVDGLSFDIPDLDQGQSVVATPVPPAVFLLGSGILGLGLCRKLGRT